VRELLSFIDHAEARHTTQNPVPADLSFFRIAQRVVARGRFRHPRQHGVLCEREFGEGLSVVGFGRSLKAIGSVAEEHPVDVQLKNLFFAQPGFDLKCQQNFSELSEERSDPA
jgi:hypothetical protein